MKISPNTFKRNILYAFGAQTVSLLLSIVMSLLIPKLLGVEEYSYWQLYLFYISYTGLFHFGLCDGVYLRTGGQDYNNLDRSSLKSQLILLASIQGVVACLLMVWSIASHVEGQRSIVFIATGLYMIAFNISGYLGYIFQATNQTHIYSASVLIDKVSFLVVVAVLLLCGTEHFEKFILFHLICKLASTVYLLFKATDIMRAKCSSFSSAVSESWMNIKVGVKLLIANIASQLILGCGRLVIDNIWGIEAFGRLSFSLSLSNFVLQFIGQVSMVLFPALCRTSDEKQKGVYEIVRNILSLILPAMFLLYLPIKKFIEFWLPDYSQSVVYLALLLPICAFDAKMQLLCNTYLKVYREETFLLKVNVIAFIVSGCLCLFSGFVLRSIDMIAIAMVTAIALRSILSEWHLSKRLSSKMILPLLGEILLSAVFIVSNLLLNSIVAALNYLIVFAIYIFLRRRDVSMVISAVANRAWQ